MKGTLGLKYSCWHKTANREGDSLACGMAAKGRLSISGWGYAVLSPVHRPFRLRDLAGR